MSERNVKLFYNEMCKNEKLQNEIKEVLSGAKTESDKQALLNDIAKKYHFDFTPEEAKKFAENLSRNQLSLDDISEVSGGIGKRTAILAFTALTALGSLGSAGAIVSHAAPPKNRQTPSSSTDTTKEGNDQNTEEIYNMYKKLDEETKNYINKYNYYAEYANKFEELVKFKELVNELEKELENEETKEETKLKYESIIEDYYTIIEDMLEEYKFNVNFIKDENIKKHLSRIKKDVEKKVRKDNDGNIITSLNTLLEARTKQTQRDISEKIRKMDDTVKIYNDFMNKKKEIDEKNQKENYGDLNFLFTASSNIKLPEENEEIIKQKNDKSQENMDNKEKNGAKGTIENQEHINNSKFLKDNINEVKKFCKKNNINDGNIYKEIDDLLKSIEFNLQIGETYKSSENKLNKIIGYVNHEYNSKSLKDNINEVKKFCKKNNINDGKIHEEIDNLLKSIDYNLQIGKTYESSKNNLNKIIADVNNKYYATRQAEVKKEKKLNSKIINEDNKNVFENLVCPKENLNLLYRMTEEGVNTEALQNKIKGHSNILVLVKTMEKKVFGGYISCKIECNNKWKIDNKAFLFSLNLNKKFNIKENEEAIYDTDSEGISFGYSDLVLFNEDDLCYSYFGNESPYENNGITINEFIGGLEKTDTTGLKYNIFAPTEIEVFEIKDIKKFEEERLKKEEEERLRKEKEERRRKEKEERRRKEEEERRRKEEEERKKKEEEINEFVEYIEKTINDTKKLPESPKREMRIKYNAYYTLTTKINCFINDRNNTSYISEHNKTLLNTYKESASREVQRLGDMLRNAKKK